jgi:hypothetical protein
MRVASDLRHLATGNQRGLRIYFASEMSARYDTEWPISRTASIKVKPHSHELFEKLNGRLHEQAPFFFGPAAQ